jgi:hypothetical protein
MAEPTITGSSYNGEFGKYISAALIYQRSLTFCTYNRPRWGNSNAQHQVQICTTKLNYFSFIG